MRIYSGKWRDLTWSHTGPKFSVHHLSKISTPIKMTVLTPELGIEIYRNLQKTPFGMKRLNLYYNMQNYSLKSIHSDIWNIKKYKPFSLHVYLSKLNTLSQYWTTFIIHYSLIHFSFNAFTLGKINVSQS